MTASLLLSKLPRAAKKENDETMAAIKAMISQFTDSCTKVVWPANTTGALGVYKAVTIEVQDANSKRVRFADNKIRRIQVDIKTAGGVTTATGITMKNAAGVEQAGDTGSLITEFTQGQSVFSVKASGAGDIVLKFTDLDSTGLTVSDEITVAVS